MPGCDSTDQKRSRETIVTVGQSGLGLPDRDYYLLGDAKMATVRNAYRGYITRMLTLANQPDPAGAADRIIAVETAIAGKHWDRARGRDRNATYNKMSVAELSSLAPSYDWRGYLSAAGDRGDRFSDRLYRAGTVATCGQSRC